MWRVLAALLGSLSHARQGPVRLDVVERGVSILLRIVHIRRYFDAFVVAP
jgi:hypothetical protein